MYDVNTWKSLWVGGVGMHASLDSFNWEQALTRDFKLTNQVPTHTDAFGWGRSASTHLAGPNSSRAKCLGISPTSKMSSTFNRTGVTFKLSLYTSTSYPTLWHGKFVGTLLSTLHPRNTMLPTTDQCASGFSEVQWNMTKPSKTCLFSSF